MPITRHFLDWNQPALPAAAAWLLERYRSATNNVDELDLSGVIVVVPGARAGRRLLELLVGETDRRSLALTPPTITTEHELPERLYQPQRPFASQLTQQLAWAEALQASPPALRRHFLPVPPEPSDHARWLELGDLLRELHRELAADDLDFQKVLAAGGQMPEFAEHDRWQALDDVRQRYLRRLDELQLWDRQTARLVAIRRREPRTDRDIVLIGMVDLNQALRHMLELVAERVTSLVVAPQSLADRFDAHGCVIASAWADAEIPIRAEDVARADGPADQAEAVTRWLASLAGRYRAEEIVVGIPDASLAPQIERQLAQYGVATRRYEARKLSETGPFRLLALAADQGERHRFRDLASLVRHPDLFDWLRDQLPAASVADPLTSLDNFAAKKIPATLDADRLKEEKDFAAVFAIHSALQELRGLLPSKPQALTDWAASLRRFLVTVYGRRELDRNDPADRLTLAAIEHIDGALTELAEIPRELDLPVNLREAFRLIIAPQAGTSLPPPAAANVVELLGWLELPLDDAPALVVTSFNEGFVPKSSATQLFLPDRLRQTLGMHECDDRRYARDAYATSVLLHSRQTLQLVVGHRDGEGNPLSPSRLLFATDEETLTRRALSLFGGPPPSRPRRSVLASDGKARPKSDLPIPPPVPTTQPLQRISVTALKSYLACPYRYYLRYVQRLESLTDSLAELDPAAFGNLLHDVLQRFGRADDAARVRTSDNPDAIHEYLSDHLDALAAAKLGVRHARPAVAVQVEQARSRLRGLAAWQAQRNAAGWQIVHSEDTDARQQLEVAFQIDAARAIKLHGRIDRIDYQPATKTLAILDYKTADAALDPHRTHVHQGEWIDLQLPLYRHLVQGATLPNITLSDCDLQLGYILLPKDVAEIREAMAEWTSTDLAAADAVARDVLRKIMSGVFWPPTAPPPAFSEEFAAITQDHVLGGWSENDAEGDAA
jgi:ATP-dependent helicase/nuclease subunit B